MNLYLNNQSENEKFSQIPVPNPSKDQGVTKESWISKNKSKIFTFIIICIVIAWATSKSLHRDAENIKITGEGVSMDLRGSNVTAELSKKTTSSFLINNGEMSSLNTGSYVVTPMKKVKELEQKYKDFIHCGSPGEAEGKSSLTNIKIIAATTDAETTLRDIKKLIKKGNLVVIEIIGYEMKNIRGINPEKTTSGIFIYETAQPDNFYLANNIKVIQKKYQ